MATSIIRLKDGVELEDFPLTVFQANPETFGFSRSRVSTLGLLGETIQMGSFIDGLDFSLTWISTDITGYEQRRLRAFFNDNESYIIDDDVFGIYQLEADVVEVDPMDFKTTTVLFSARYSTQVDVYREILLEQQLYGSDLAYFSGNFAGGNQWENRAATLQLTIEATDPGSPPIWLPGTKVMLGYNTQWDPSAPDKPQRQAYVSFNIAGQTAYGDWSLIQKRKRIAFDTTRKIAGEGYFDSDTVFGRLDPLDVFDGFIMFSREDSQDVVSPSFGSYTVKIELVAPGLVE